MINVAAVVVMSLQLRRRVQRPRPCAARCCLTRHNSADETRPQSRTRAPAKFDAWPVDDERVEAVVKSRRW